MEARLSPQPKPRIRKPRPNRLAIPFANARIPRDRLNRIPARARDQGSIKLIDIVRARLDARTDPLIAELPSLALNDVRIDDRLANPVGIVEVAVEKGAHTILMPIACRKQLIDLSDDMATRINVQFYSDAPEALLKTLLEQGKR